MRIKSADWKWLRAASLDHPGYLPGMPWMTCAFAFERLLENGLVSRAEFPGFNGDKTFIRAVITEKGREALVENGAAMMARSAAASAVSESA